MVLLNLDLSVSFFMHLYQNSYYLESSFETDPHLEAIGIAVDVNFKWIYRQWFNCDATWPKSQ